MRALGALTCEKASDKSGPIAPTISGPLERRTTSLLPLAYRARFSVISSPPSEVPFGEVLCIGDMSPTQLAAQPIDTDRLTD